MRTGLFYLQSAKHHELADLHYLGASTALARASGHLIHQLQRERGLSNLYLASGGQRAKQARLDQIALTVLAQAGLEQTLDRFDLLQARPGSATRLYSAMAFALQGLQALPHWRDRVAAQTLDAQASTRGYNRLVAALLSLVFEAADTATDPHISRLLVSMFHFIQGKELAGQERAAGTAMFATGTADPTQQDHLRHLMADQQRCLQNFADLASDAAKALWQDTQGDAAVVELEHLRGVLCASTPHGALNPESSETWFSCCSLRIDQMKRVEDALADHLHALCQSKAQAAQQDLQRLMALSEPAGGGDFFDAPTHACDPLTDPALQSRLGRSVLQLVVDQAQRLVMVNDELSLVRAKLNDRAIIERAKGQLMQQSGLSENDAHHFLRQMAMNQGRRLVDVAQTINTRTV